MSQVSLDQLVQESSKPFLTHSMSRNFNSYAGVDIRVMVDGEVDGKVQSISVKTYKDDSNVWKAAVTLIRLQLDDGIGNFPDFVDVIQVLGANEYGASCVLFELHDCVVESVSTGFSIDDLVVEENYTLRANKFVKGRPIRVIDLKNAQMIKSLHTKHIERVESDTVKALMDKAIDVTSEEPVPYIQALTKLLEKYKVVI